MKKLYLLLSVLFLIYWGCEDEQDTTSTGVTLWGEVYSVEETDSLDLSGSYYNHHNLGKIPSYLGELINLEYLKCNYCDLTGEIPPEIGNLTNLTGLL
ncbi:uncharacterized protein METZ01_LOCUS37683, partial [marine metagenome]